MERYEFKRVCANIDDAKDNNRLARFGLEGWSIVATVDKNTYILQRPVSEQEAEKRLQDSLLADEFLDIIQNTEGRSMYDGSTEGCDQCKFESICLRKECRTGGHLPCPVFCKKAQVNKINKI